MKFGQDSDQGTMRKDSDGWKASVPPGAPFVPVTNPVGMVMHAWQVFGKKPLVVTERVAPAAPKALLDPDKSLPPFEQAVRRSEATIIGHPHERALVFDKDGKVIFAREGGRGSVGFSGEELAKFKGRVFTHNHPEMGGSFSPADIQLASSHDLHEIRAVAHNSPVLLDGKSYIHRAIRPANGWESLEPALNAFLQEMGKPLPPKDMPFGEKLGKVVHWVCFWPAHATGSPDPDPAHRALSHLRDKIGLRYYRNELKE